EDFRSADYFGEIVRRAYGLYQQRLVESNAMDFDDLLMNTALLLTGHEEVRQKYQQRYEYVLVDEFQDTNLAQYELVRILARPQDNVFVVGDEDQGIYAFRGADYRNVMQFRKDYPSAKVVLLEQNYRSTQVVLDAARAIIDKNKHRTPKALFTDRSGGALVTVQEAYSEQEEGEWIARRVEELRRERQGEYSDFAVMYRTNAQSRALEESFVRAGLPYRLIGGVGFYKRREVKDLIAYLKLINNPNDREVFQRVVNVPGRGIGDKSIASFIEWAQAQHHTLAEALEAAASDAVLPLVGRAAKGMAEFARLLRDLRFMAAQNLLAAFDELIGRTGYSLYLNEISDTAEQTTERLENVQALRGVIAEKKDLALDEFLADAALVSEIDQIDAGADAVTLLTLHSAKGLEYPVVFITGVEDGLLPHSRTFSEPEEMAEERRLLYVGLTRAKDELYLTYAYRRTLYGDSSLSTPSRFFDDIPPELMTGLSPQIRGAQQRAGYRHETTWERSEPAYTSSGIQSPKIIHFPTGGRTDVAPKRRSAPAGPPTKYRSGMRVYHTKFGKGV
ncbi:MAG TPA: 3'-5' exonuclease, partial [Candidatus Limnocylindrales bacterium]|nr:3'-5' exonuclease [Candidatus Limnocylindrales bacterium]